MSRKNVWETYDGGLMEELEQLNKTYRDFLDNGKTERECIDTIVNTIESQGYQELETYVKSGRKPVKGDRIDRKSVV